MLEFTSDWNLHYISLEFTWIGIYICLFSGAAWGKGAYFAKDASLSRSYTRPGSDNVRTVLYCKILAGTLTMIALYGGILCLCKYDFKFIPSHIYDCGDRFCIRTSVWDCKLLRHKLFHSIQLVLMYCHCRYDQFLLLPMRCRPKMWPRVQLAF